MKQNHIDHNAVESRKVLDRRKAWLQIKLVQKEEGKVLEELQHVPAMKTRLDTFLSQVPHLAGSLDYPDTLASP